MASSPAPDDAKDPQGSRNSSLVALAAAADSPGEDRDDANETWLGSGSFLKKKNDDAVDAGSSSNPFDLSAMAGLLNDPSIKELAEQIAKDPAFRDMAKALQHNLQNDGQPDIPKFNTPAYFRSMEKIVDDPQFVNMAQRLGSTLMEDPETASILQTLRNSGTNEAQMSKDHIDQNLMPILEEIERGGPAMMMKYMEDPELLSKLGNAVGLVIPQVSVTHHDGPLYEEVAGVENQGGSRLLNAASIGDLEVVKSLLAADVDKDQTDVMGRAALHLASGYGEATCVEALLEAGVAIDAVDKNKNTALHYAAGHGMKDCVELLLKYGASVTVQNLDGKTALEAAQMNGQADILKLLQTNVFL